MFCSSGCCQAKEDEKPSKTTEVFQMDEMSPITPVSVKSFKEVGADTKNEEPVKGCEEAPPSTFVVEAKIVEEAPAAAPTREAPPTPEPAAEPAAEQPPEAERQVVAEQHPAEQPPEQEPPAQETPVEAVPIQEATPEPAAEQPPAAEQAPAEGPVVTSGDVVEFTFTATKKDATEGLGLRILPDRATFVVSSVLEGGCIHRWNTSDEAKAESKVVRYGTVLYELNGASGSLQDMLKIASESTLLTFKARRYNKYSVTVNKSGGLLGLELKEGTVTVSHLAEPATIKHKLALENYNATCEIGKEILTDDVVTEVNGTMGDASAITKAMQMATGEMTIVFTRA